MMGRRRWLGVLLATLLAVAALPLPALAEAPSSGRDVLLAGVYSDQWEASHDVNGLSTASGKRVSLVGTFHRLLESEQGWEGTTDWRLEQAWAARATPLANLEIVVPAAEIAAGAHDLEITAWARRVEDWLGKGGGRSLLIAPMQEMNGDWVPYGMDPENFKIGYRRIVDIFRQQGIDETEVRWVFAPNAWSVWPYRIADYYPGDDVVDLVGVSVYNFGQAVGRWTTVEEAFGSALDELRTIAPFKPFLVTQVGSSTAGGDRDAWLRDLFATAAADPNIVGLVYFNFLKETDWKLWDGAALARGWQDGVRQKTTVYRWPLTSWFRPGPLRFTPYTGTFADDDMLSFQQDIEWLVEKRITQGCDTRLFCPGQPVTREQLATFMVRALDLPPAGRDYFTDDAGSTHEGDINALAAAGLTSGCGPGIFCPLAVVDRQQLAGLLARAVQLPPATGSWFGDIAGSPFEADINALAAAGVTGGCGPNAFCPTSQVHRQELAALLRRSIETTEPVIATPIQIRMWGRVRPY
jgi:beta-mannanase